MPDQSHVCDLHHSSRQCQMFNPVSGARDRTCVFMDTSQVCFHWATRATPTFYFLWTAWYGWCRCFSPLYLSSPMPGFVTLDLLAAFIQLPLQVSQPEIHLLPLENKICLFKGWCFPLGYFPCSRVPRSPPKSEQMFSSVQHHRLGGNFGVLGVLFRFPIRRGLRLAPMKKYIRQRQY